MLISFKFAASSCDRNDICSQIVKDVKLSNLEYFLKLKIP